MMAKAFPYPDRRPRNCRVARRLQGQEWERGTSLVEAMVSIAILAIAVLGIGFIITGSYQAITATELDVNQQQRGMQAEVFGTKLPAAQTVTMSIEVPGSGGNPLVTGANPVTLIPVDNLLTLSIVAGTGVARSTESVQYGVIRNVTNHNQWWIP